MIHFHTNVEIHQIADIGDAAFLTRAGMFCHILPDLEQDIRLFGIGVWLEP
ncbi:hypothetical protein D3C83_207980 [compost metagenome]